MNFTITAKHHPHHFWLLFFLLREEAHTFGEKAPLRVDEMTRSVESPRRCSSKDRLASSKKEASIQQKNSVMGVEP